MTAPRPSTRLLRGYGPLAAFAAMFVAISLFVPTVRTEIRTEPASSDQGSGAGGDTLLDGEDPAAVPSLVNALKDRDAYVFREVHDALWKLTSSEMPAMLPKDLTPEVMETIAKGWTAWYDENRDRYRKFETAPK